MDQDPQTREEYRAKSLSKMSRNSSLATHSHTAGQSKFWPKLLGLVAIFALTCSVAYGARLYFSFHSVLGSGGTYQRLGSSNPSLKIAQQKPISVLILGVDQGIEGRHDQGNSDTMILATLNPQTRKATLTSIPRDLDVSLQGVGRFYMTRVNTAYQLGGNKAAVKTVSKLLNVPIDYYAEVNMQALEGVVDAVGGVDVQVPFSFTYNTHFDKGKMHLNGKQALDYARMRHDDPRGDYGRQARQRQIISALGSKVKSLNTSDYEQLLKIIKKYVRMNFTEGDLIGLIRNYRSVAANIKSDYIHGHEAWIGGASMQIASTKELKRVSNYTRSNLGLAKATLDNQETRQNRINEQNNNIDWDNPNAFTNYIIYEQDSETPWQG